MRAAAHDPEFAKKHDISPSVAKDFVREDKKRARRMFKEGKQK